MNDMCIVVLITRFDSLSPFSTNPHVPPVSPRGLLDILYSFYFLEPIVLLRHGSLRSRKEGTTRSLFPTSAVPEHNIVAVLIEKVAVPQLPNRQKVAVKLRKF